MPKRRKQQSEPVAIVEEDPSPSAAEPPPPPEPVAASPPAPAPPALVPEREPETVQKKRMGRPPADWFQIEEKKLKAMHAAYESAERSLEAKLDAANEKGGGLDLETAPSLQARCRAKMEKRRRKVEEMRRAWLEAADKYQGDKFERAARLAIRAVDALENLTERHALLKEVYNVTDLQCQLEKRKRCDAEAALQRSATQNRVLLRENRCLRAELAGEDEWAEEQLAADLLWCEQYLRGEAPPSELEAHAAVRDARWDEEAAIAEQRANSEKRRARELMPPPPARA